jgi:uncharacterized membrane protein
MADRPRVKSPEKSPPGVRAEAASGSGPSAPGFETLRIQTLADGIFGISMTLLVLDLKMGAPMSGDLIQQLRGILPKLFAYVISFLILGLYWTGHHAEFHYICRTDRRHLWLNILILMGVALVPFSASLLAEEKTKTLAVLVYCSNIVLITGAFLLHWSYATKGHRLVMRDIDPAAIRDVKKRLLTSAVLMIAALSLSLWNPEVSFTLYLLIQVAYIWRSTRTATGMPDAE